MHHHSEYTDALSGSRCKYLHIPEHWREWCACQHPVHIVIISLDLKRDRCGYIDNPPERLLRTETIGRNPDADLCILLLYLLHHLHNIWKMDRWRASYETDLIRVWRELS